MSEAAGKWEADHLVLTKNVSFCYFIASLTHPNIFSECLLCFQSVLSNGESQWAGSTSHALANHFSLSLEQQDSHAGTTISYTVNKLGLCLLYLLQIYTTNSAKTKLELIYLYMWERKGDWVNAWEGRREERLAVGGRVCVTVGGRERGRP